MDNILLKNEDDDDSRTVRVGRDLAYLLAIMN
jgi:hypothetical protein